MKHNGISFGRIRDVHFFMMTILNQNNENNIQNALNDLTIIKYTLYTHSALHTVENTKE